MNRTGIVRRVYSTGIKDAPDYHVVFEVEELGTAGEMTKIKVIETSGVPAVHLVSVTNLLQTWLKTSEITWMDEEVVKSTKEIQNEAYEQGYSDGYGDAKRENESNT